MSPEALADDTPCREDVAFFDDRVQHCLRRFAFDFGKSLSRSYLVVFFLGWFPVAALEYMGLLIGIHPEVRFVHDYAAIVYMASVPLLMFARRIFTAEWSFVFETILTSKIVEESERERLRSDFLRIAARFDRWPLFVFLGLGAMGLSGSILFFTILEGRNFWFVASEWVLTPSGIYHWGLNVPVFLFVLLYWISKYVLWVALLWRFSRSSPRIYASHPDRTGGLGFLADSTLGLSLFMFSIGAILTTTVLYKIHIEGVTITSTPVLIIMISYTVVAAALLLAPLLCFTGVLYRARKKAIRELTEAGILFCESMNRMEDGAETFKLLQAQADLAVAFENVHKMKIWPIDVRSFFRFAATTALPLLPLFFQLQ